MTDVAPRSGSAPRVAALAIVALAGFSAGCKERPEEAPGAALAEGRPAEASQADAAVDALEATLILEAFDPGIRVSRFSRVELAAGRVRQGRPVHLLGSFLGPGGAELAARSGSDLVVATAVPWARGPQSHRLVRPYALGTKDVPLGDFPLSSLALVGRRAFVGGQGLLGMVDFASSAPKLEILLRSPRPPSEGARTLIAAQGDCLMAIEGAAPPFLADAFRLRREAPPLHEQHVSLPPVAGWYSGAALLGQELLLVAEVGGRGVRGRSLRRIALGGLADARLRSAPAAAVDFEVVSEWEAAPPDRGGKASAARPAWRGLAAVGGMLVLCAGERGALVLPRAFSERTKPLFVDVDGLCIDLVGSAGKAYALVRTGQGMKIVWLADSPQGLGVEGSVAITGLWSGLVP